MVMAIAWRSFSVLAIGVLVAYIFILELLLFQTTSEDARQVLRYYDPELGKPLPERSYAEDCRVYTPEHPDGAFANIADKMDIFVPGHLLGWYMKALIVRDVWLASVVSVGFELMEYTLECQLPNFGECWWDHWLLDVVLCNGIGIYLGVLTCRLLSIKTFDWMGLWRVSENERTTSRQKCGWGHTEKFIKFLCVVSISVVWMLQELNGFYQKTTLWIAPDHALVMARHVVFLLNAPYVLENVFECLENRDKTSLGIHFWLAMLALTFETLLEIKFGWEILSIPLPKMAVVAWSIFFVVLTVWSLWYFSYPIKQWPVLQQHFFNRKTPQKKQKFS